MAFTTTLYGETDLTVHQTFSSPTDLLDLPILKPAQQKPRNKGDTPTPGAYQASLKVGVSLHKGFNLLFQKNAANQLSATRAQDITAVP